MAAATVGYRSGTSNSIVLDVNFDPSGAGVTIPIATLYGYMSAGNLKRFFASVTDGNCADLNPDSSNVKNKKLRIYTLGTVAALSEVDETSDKVVRFVAATGLVIPAQLVTGSTTQMSVEIRFLHSLIR